jgi:hypothetical protein
MNSSQGHYLLHLILYFRYEHCSTIRLYYSVVHTHQVSVITGAVTCNIVCAKSRSSSCSGAVLLFDRLLMHPLLLLYTKNKCCRMLRES